MSTTIKRLVELLDTNFGYSDEAPAQQIAERLESNGLVFADDLLNTVVKHGRYAAAKWAGYADQRKYWEARYCGIQALYSDLNGSSTAYADFNAKCGVVFETGHIVAADGTKCTD